MSQRVRLATYNIHKCRGMDRRVRPERIADVIAGLDADVIALQEIFHAPKLPGSDQLNLIAKQLGYDCRFGEARLHRGVPYGNAFLSRLPIRRTQNYDLTWRKRERRGCLRCDIDAGGATLHIFNVHLGTGFFERRHQGRKLVAEDVVLAKDLTGPRIVVGDFNEWTHGLATRLMHGSFESVDMKAMARRRTTYPGFLPLLHLDHFYYDRSLKLESFAVVRTRTALVASDHLPLVAEFTLAG